MSKSTKAKLVLVVDSRLKKLFKRLCLDKERNMSDIGQELIIAWCSQHELEAVKQMELAQPVDETIVAHLTEQPSQIVLDVRNFYARIVEDSSIDPVRLQTIVDGVVQPTEDERKEIYNILENVKNRINGNQIFRT